MCVYEVLEMGFVMWRCLQYTSMEVRNWVLGVVVLRFCGMEVFGFYNYEGSGWVL